MSCLKCESECEDGALICGECADACFRESRFFLTPVLIGPSLYARLRSEGSVASMLGPTADRDISLIASADVRRTLQDTVLEGLTEDEARSIIDLCNRTLAHMGVPVKYDPPTMALTEDAADTILMVLRLIDALSERDGSLLSSDICLRLGVVHWTASHGVLLRTASRSWRDEKKAYLLGRAKYYFSRVDERDDLFSIAVWNLGMLCTEAGDWEAAKQHLEKTRMHFPSDDRVAECLVKAELELGNPVEALSMVDEILIQSVSAQLWLLKGEILLKVGRSGEALECFNQALSLDPGYIDAHNKLIATLRAMGRDEEATMAERQRMIFRTPGIEEKILDVIGELTLTPSQPTLARARVRPMARVKRDKDESIPPPVAESPLSLAAAALEAKDYDIAIQRSQHIVDADPSSREANLVLIEALVESGDLPGAADRVHAFYERNRNDPHAWYWRGIVAEKEGKWGAAVQYLSKAVTIDPELADAWASMGDTLFANEKYNGADESYSRALQIDAGIAKAWLGKGKTMRALGRWGAAIQCLDKYNSIAPNDRQAWLLKADTLLEKEKYRRAVDAYNKYLELYQDDSYALGRKGQALNAIGMVDEAIACLEESVRLDSNNRDALKLLRAISNGGGV
ncbi:MAG TPA: tetratricopeptide repeat protein [Thermoplasmata archaeon]|nr:tetratricopeptide repeat protein [Thermoplasmata archaeon]